MGHRLFWLGTPGEGQQGQPCSVSAHPSMTASCLTLLLPRARLGFSQDHRLCAPHGREAGSLSWGHQPPHKDKHPLGAKEYEKSSILTSQKSVLASSREESPRSVPRDRAKENLSFTGVKEEERRLRRIQFSPSFGHPSDFKKQKQEDLEKTKPDKNKQSLNRLDIAEGTRGQQLGQFRK